MEEEKDAFETDHFDDIQLPDLDELDELFKNNEKVNEGVEEDLE